MPQKGDGGQMPKRPAPIPPTTHEPFPQFPTTTASIAAPLSTSYAAGPPLSPLREGYYGAVVVERQATELPYVDASVFEPSMSSQIRSPGRGGGGATSEAAVSGVPRRHGRGLMVYADRTIYEGDWVDDVRHGQGICYFPSGNIYMGSFVHGHMEGQGSMLYHDGDFFTGSFRLSSCHGVGVFYSGGTEVRGEWRNGVRVAVQKRRGTSIEDFDAQRLHYETFRAVLSQLHGHFTYYALFDNRFQRTQSTFVDAAAVDIVVEPLRPALPQVLVTASSSAAGEKDLLLYPAGHFAENGDANDASSSAKSPGSTGLTPPRSALGIKLASERAGGGAHRASFSFDADIDNIQPAMPNRRRLSSPPQQSLQPAPESTLLDPRRRHRTRSLDHTFNSPTKSSGLPKEPVPPLFTTSTAHHLAPSLMASPHQVSHHPSSFAQHTGGGGVGVAVGGASDGPPKEAAVLSPSNQQQHTKLSAAALVVRSSETLNRKTASARVLFASSGPMSNEHFSFGEYIRYVISFLFPLLSIPHIPWCPLLMTGLEMEREFVVSGAALSHDFTPPKGAVYISLAGFVIHLIAIIVAGAASGSSASMGNKVQHIELIGPALAWMIFAFVCAGYHGYFRVAHALERLDRRLAPKLASYAASVVDASADICVFTWDEEGRSKITNPHYKYRWLFCSFIVGGVCAFAVPVTRSAFGFEAFLSTSRDEATTVVALSFIAMFLFTSGITFYVLKITDMQRQVASQLQVLTKLAFLDGVSMTAPSEHRSIKFDFDSVIDLGEVFCGFVGWWIHRNFILAASACSNHCARATSVTAVVLGQLLICLIVVGDAAYAGASGQLRLGGPASDQRTGEIYFTGAHGLALVWVPLGSFLVTRYLIACVATQDELKAHLSIMSVAAMYHNIQPTEAQGVMVGLDKTTSGASGALIHACRATAAEHDPRPTIASISVSNFGVVLLLAVDTLAFALLWVLFADAVNKS